MYSKIFGFTDCWYFPINIQNIFFWNLSLNSSSCFFLRDLNIDHLYIVAVHNDHVYPLCINKYSKFTESDSDIWFAIYDLVQQTSMVHRPIQFCLYSLFSTLIQRKQEIWTEPRMLNSSGKPHSSRFVWVLLLHVLQRKVSFILLLNLKFKKV
jgi:hypothetical protein